jgi:hypothetical protein
VNVKGDYMCTAWTVTGTGKIHVTEQMPFLLINYEKIKDP